MFEIIVTDYSNKMHTLWKYRKQSLIHVLFLIHLKWNHNLTPCKNQYILAYTESYLLLLTYCTQFEGLARAMFKKKKSFRGPNKANSKITTKKKRAYLHMYQPPPPPPLFVAPISCKTKRSIRNFSRSSVLMSEAMHHTMVVVLILQHKYFCAICKPRNMLFTVCDMMSAVASGTFIHMISSENTASAFFQCIELFLASLPVHWVVSGISPSVLFLTFLPVRWVVSGISPRALSCFWHLSQCIELFLASLPVFFLLTFLPVCWVVSGISPSALSCFWHLSQCVELFLASLPVRRVVSGISPSALSCFWSLPQCCGLFHTSVPVLDYF